MTQKKNIVQILFLVLFLTITLSIHFVHSEKTLGNNKTCPACHFQSSTPTTSQIHFFYFPPLCSLEILSSLEADPYITLCFITPSSRAPPLV